MTIREIIAKGFEFDKTVEENRQKAAHATRSFLSILECPEVMENKEEIAERWTAVTNTLADLKDAMAKFDELLEKDVKED